MLRLGKVPFQCDWTNAQLGKAEYLLEKIPPDSIVEIIETCISSWDQAVDYVENNSSGFKVPQTPDFDAFHRHKWAMVHFHATENVSKIPDDPLDWFKHK